MNRLTGTIMLATERRGAERQEADDDALALVHGCGATNSCVVVEISDTGARVELNEACVIPKRFKLWIADRHMLAECEQVWRKKSTIGLRFVSVVYID